MIALLRISSYIKQAVKSGSTHKDYTNNNPHQNIDEHQQRDNRDGRKRQSFQHRNLRMIALTSIFQPKINGVLAAFLNRAKHQGLGWRRHCCFLEDAQGFVMFLQEERSKTARRKITV